MSGNILVVGRIQGCCSICSDDRAPLLLLPSPWPPKSIWPEWQYCPLCEILRIKTFWVFPDFWHICIVHTNGNRTQVYQGNAFILHMNLVSLAWSKFCTVLPTFECDPLHDVELSDVEFSTCGVISCHSQKGFQFLDFWIRNAQLVLWKVQTYGQLTVWTQCPWWPFVSPAGLMQISSV